mgnify:CR=1 FL=1
MKSKPLYPEISVAKGNDLAEPVTKLTFHKPGQVYPAMAFGESHYSLAYNVGSTVAFELPKKWYGYILHIGIEKYDSETTPTIQCLINGDKIFEHRIINRHYSHGRPYGGFEIPIPIEYLSYGKENVISLRNSSEGYWEGRLYIIPGYFLRTLLPYILPICGFIVIISATFVPSSYRSRWLPLLLAFVMFFVYRYTYFVHDHTGFGGYFFDDIRDLIKEVSGDKYTHDMMRHPVFLPLMRVFYGIWRAIGLDKLDAMSAGFAFVACINVALAFILFRITCHEKLNAIPLILTYSFLFAVWAYSSLYETYILSALSVHLTMIFLWAKPVTKSLRNIFYLAIMISISALINPPMLLLFSVGLAILIMSGMPSKRKYLYCHVMLELSYSYLI